MTFHELYMALDARFPKSLSCEWDNDGIMCADDLSKPVKKVLITLDVTDEAVKYAIKKGFDTIISHHPLVFKAQKSLCELNFVQKKLISLIKEDIRAMSFHTRLDAGNGGVNDTLASELGFVSIEPDPADPIGRVCELGEEMSPSAFAKKVKKTISAPFVKYAGSRNVKKVYIVGGDGKDLIANAIECGADTLLTGDASYNAVLDADEMGLNVIEAGHYYTEYLVCETIENLVKIFDDKIKTEIFTSNKIEVI